jgi:hypothetical protein
MACHVTTLLQPLVGMNRKNTEKYFRKVNFYLEVENNIIRNHKKSDFDVYESQTLIEKQNLGKINPL